MDVITAVHFALFLMAVAIRARCLLALWLTKKRLVAKGYNEVVLTGVDITSWGDDLPGNPPLGDLVQRILKLVPDLPRLRISSIDSVEADQALVDAIASERRLMPHLHLSLQAGDNMILKRMKRRHLRDDAIAFCEDMRKARPDIVYGADIIAGFPTETEAMFANSLKLAEECGLTWLHVFPFSPRQGTPAARMPLLEKTVIKERAKRLREAGAKVEHAFVVFHYGIFEASKQNMKDLGITLHALTTWWSVLDVAKENDYFDKETLESVEAFLNNPIQWQDKND